jgi:hypothetical protein
MSDPRTLLRAPALALVSLTVLSLGACTADLGEGEDHDHEHPVDMVAGQNARHTMQGLAHSGRWQPPPEVLAIAELQQVVFNNAPAWDDGANCSGGATDGALVLRQYLLGFFPQVASIGIYNCRVIAGTNSMSLHGVGRALDIMIPTVGGEADNDLGDPIAHWLMMNAAAMGIQTIIWDRSIWRVSNNPRIHEYTGSNPHVDHLHVEINVAAGNEDPAWFDAPFGPEACAALAGGESVLDNGDDCLRLYGPGQYWRDEAAGFGGDLMWTNAFESDAASNWAEWTLPFEEPGEYEVAVYVDGTFGVHSQTRYEVSADGETHVVVVDQGAASGWTTLGTWRFSGAAGERVAVFDNAAGAVADEQHIVVDALRVRPPTGEPPAEEPPTGEPPAEEPPVQEPPAEEPGEEPGEEPAPPDPGPVDDDDPGVASEPLRLRPADANGASCAAAAPAEPSLGFLVVALSLVARRRSFRP